MGMGVASGLGLALVIQALLLLLFSLRWTALRRSTDRWPLTPEGGWPELEVLLCLRGVDPSLQGLMAALAAQRYPGRWHLQMVVDRETDPAWPLVQPWLEASGAGWSTIRCSALQERPLQGSLKCAALRQACAGVKPSTELVVLLDADASLAADGLARLARACWRPGVGAVSGNRWYAPSGAGLLSWTRAVWGAAALVLMTLLQIPWGGTLAVRRSVVEAGDWIKLLERGLCEDTGLLQPLRQQGLRYEPRPELLVVERGDVKRWGGLQRWISRQMLTARLHHPAWPLVLLYGLGSTAVLVLLLGALLAGAVQPVVFYELGCWILLLLLQRQVIGVWPDRREAGGWGLALLPGQAIHTLTTLGAWGQRRVEWRGVHYAVTEHPAGVRRLNEEID